MRTFAQSRQLARRGLDAWEKATAELLDVVLRSRVAIEPAGAVVTSLVRVKGVYDTALGACWRVVGLPTRRDHERAMHALTEIESRLLDIEDWLKERAP